MKSLDDELSFASFQRVWQRSPWGIAVIGKEGNVQGVNAAFENCTGLIASTVVGLTEANFNTQIRVQFSKYGENKYHRVEITEGDLRAIYYFNDTQKSSSYNASTLATLELIREPLASIYGFAELLLNQNYNEATRRILTSTILEQTEAISDIINNTFIDQI